MSNDEHDVWRLFHAIFDQRITFVYGQVPVGKETDGHPNSEYQKDVPTHLLSFLLPDSLPTWLTQLQLETQLFFLGNTGAVPRLGNAVVLTFLFIELADNSIWSFCLVAPRTTFSNFQKIYIIFLMFEEAKDVFLLL